MAIGYNLVATCNLYKIHHNNTNSDQQKHIQADIIPYVMPTSGIQQDAYCESENEECLVRETDTCYPYSCLHVGECVPKNEALSDMCQMPIQIGSCE